MEWFNEAPQWNVDGSTITITSGPKTDFWRKTHDGMVRDSGHFYYQQVTGDFTAEAKITGKYEALYDQAGLMVRQDEITWLKCGVEFLDGVQQASAVVTRDFSDWSVVPLPQNPPSLWSRLTRKGLTIEIHYSLDGQQYHLLRQAYLTPYDTLMVGPMIASPQGRGFTATFEGFQVLML
jgi:uncharacterized protein